MCICKCNRPSFLFEYFLNLSSQLIVSLCNCVLQGQYNIRCTASSFHNLKKFRWWHLFQTELKLKPLPASIRGQHDTPRGSFAGPWENKHTVRDERLILIQLLSLPTAGPCPAELRAKSRTNNQASVTDAWGETHLRWNPSLYWHVSTPRQDSVQQSQLQSPVPWP